jgi:putative ABC transport system ATP-binding protein
MVAAAWLVMELLQSVVRTEGVTAVVATHDPLLLDIADRVLELRDGKLTELPTGEPADRVLRRYAPPTI